MKPPHHCRWRPYFLLACVLLLSSLSISSAQSQNQDLSSQEENSRIALEETRQIQSPLPTSSGSKPFLLEEDVKLFFLPYEKKSFFYYSNRENAFIDIFLRMTVPYKEAGENTEEAINMIFKKSQMARGRYWSEKDIKGEGEGQEQEISQGGQWVYFGYHNETHFILNNNFYIERGQKGKYLIEITNLWDFNIELQAMPVPLPISQNFEHRPTYWDTSRERTYDFLMVTPGEWYLSIFTRDLPVNITIESVKKKDVVALQNGGYLYQETIENKSIDERKDRFRTITVTIPSEIKLGDVFAWDGKIEIYSMMVNEPEFQLEEDPKEMIVTKKYEYKDMQIHPIVQFEPLKFKELKSTVEIEYQVELFLENPEANYEKGLMTERIPGPSSSKIRVPIDHKEPITARFAGTSEDFSCYIRITAFIAHGPHIIKYLTYPIGYMSERDPVLREDMRIAKNIGIVAVGLVSLMFVVIAGILWMKGWKKVGEAWSGRSVEHAALEEEREGVDLNGDAGSPNNDVQS